MPPLRPNNFTAISTNNIIDVPRPGRRTRSRQGQKPNVPSPALVSTSNILDGPNTPRRTRRGIVLESPVVRTASTRQEARHDPMTRKDRAARLQRTTKGKFAKTNPESKGKTRRQAPGEETTQDEEDPRSQLDDSRTNPATTNALEQSDGNATRTAYQGPNASQLTEHLEEAIADANVGSKGQDNVHGSVVGIPDASDGNATARTAYQGPTARQMLKALEESVADAKDVSTNDRNSGNGAASAGPSRAGSPVSAKNWIKRVFTWPNGRDNPPLITYIYPQAQAPPPPQPPPPSPQRHIPPPLRVRHIPLPLFPNHFHPGIIIDPPSRSPSPPVGFEVWNHQPRSFDSLVPREGGYARDSIERWPNLANPVVKRMKKQGKEIRGEKIVIVEEEEEEDGQFKIWEDKTAQDGSGETTAQDGDGETTGDSSGMPERGQRAMSEISSVGDPADTTLSEIDELMKEY
ncbi:MAG: hypothetical protein Q9226_004903 [Calogaya cf. arnoldii]